MSHEIIIKHCAPTLAGLKIGNLFSYRYTNPTQLISQVHQLNHSLNKKGIYVICLRQKNGLALIYVYRDNSLKNLLHTDEIQEFLKAYGYKDFSVSACMKILMHHLTINDFPHEIGLFLGYPLADVKAFIDNKGSNSKCVGCWKVYHDVDSALVIFNKYKKCTNIYCKKHASGFDLEQLTVAG